MNLAFSGFGGPGSKAVAQAVRSQPAGEISLLTGLAEPVADTGGRQRLFATLAGMIYP